MRFQGIMGFICNVELQNGRTGAMVQADLVTLAYNHVADYEDIWQQPLRQYGEEDKAFSWRVKQQVVSRQSRFEGYAIECDGLTQGLMLLNVEEQWSQFTFGKQLVLVDALAAAPWNRATIQRSRDYKLVGRSLLWFAQRRSAELGYAGRVGVFALPGAVTFYERMGMTRLELEPDEILDAEEKMPYFEYIVVPTRREADYGE